MEGDPTRPARPGALLARCRSAASGRVARWVTVVVLGMLGGGLGVAVAGSVHQQVGPLDTTFSLRPERQGGTQVDIAPLGALVLRTHDGPAALVVRVDRLRLPQAQALLGNPTAAANLASDVERDARRGVERLVRRSLLVAVLAGAVVGLVHRPHWRSAVVAAASAGIAVGGSLAIAVGTFRADSLAEPRYTGLLTLAPQAIGDVRDATSKFATWRNQLNGVVDNVSALYRSTQSIAEGPSSDTIRVLHVSDLHLNPAGFDLVGQMVSQFHPDAVVDTGDINDWGTSFESAFVDRVGSFGVPYVYVRGNHDSPETQQAVAAQPHAVVLDDRSVEVAGLRFWGVGDPRFTADKELFDDRDRERSTAQAFVPVARDELARAQAAGPVDVALVHDPSIGAGIAGSVPLLLAGHTHVASQHDVGATTMLIEGSTGGAGLRGANGGSGVPLECSMLYFEKRTHRLLAYDEVTVHGLGGSGAQIERHYLPGAASGATTSSSTTSTTSD